MCLDAVNGPAGGDPRVVRGARPELGAVPGHPWVAADVAGAGRVAQQVRVVERLPDEDQMRRGHELGDERTALRRARKRIRAHAEPAVVPALGVVLPELELAVDDNRLLLEEDLPALHREQGSGGGRRARTRMTLVDLGVPARRVQATQTSFWFKLYADRPRP